MVVVQKVVIQQLIVIVQQQYVETESVKAVGRIVSVVQKIADVLVQTVPTDVAVTELVKRQKMYTIVR